MSAITYTKVGDGVYAVLDRGNRVGTVRKETKMVFFLDSRGIQHVPDGWWAEPEGVTIEHKGRRASTRKTAALAMVRDRARALEGV